MKNKNKPVAFDGYNKMAKLFHEQADTKPHNAYYERPATISLLPDVKGLSVLDAACGPGWYSEWLFNHGAKVTSLDVSPEMLKYAKERLKGYNSKIICADLDKELPFEDEIFDIVLLPLAISYLKDIEFTLEFNRVLKNSGLFIFSDGHPFHDFSHRSSKSDNYFNSEFITITWQGFGEPIEIPFFRRSLSSVSDALWNNGFVIERILEPKPTEDFKNVDPEDYEKLMKFPGFICFRCKKL
ncbi:MAG: class I SAM-dependent methyltransferase [Caldisericia bacterium]